MDTMVEAPRQSTALPSINNLDSVKMKDEDDTYRPRQALPSPMFRFTAVQTQTTQEEQRTFPSTAAPIRQSLPSLQEALGRGSAPNFSGPPPLHTPSAVPTSSSSYFHPSSTTNPIETSRRPSPIYNRCHSFSTGPLPSPSRTSSDHVNQGPPSSFSAHVSKPPSLKPIHTGHAQSIGPGRLNGQYTPGSAPSTYGQSPQSAPAHASFPHPRHQSSYQPSASASYAASPGLLSRPPPHSHWAGESGPRSPIKPMRPHDSSVKRNLSQFDLEASLYECVTNGQEFVELSQSCAKRARQHGKTDDAEYAPTSDEVTHMAAKMANMQRAFHRMQEISEMHHAEAQEQQKEMHRQYRSMHDDGSGYMHDTHGEQGMGSDPKKRRGRAAPPGRCHSCNRAETPEWRRGPDGARTLCNACGLHYAKLTRKMGPQQKANISSSNLRPKGV